MRRLLGCDLSGIGLLASANLTVAGVVDLFDKIDPVMHVLLNLGQLAVAAATTVYIVKRTIQLGKEKKK
jgi:hypothetical protein